MPNKSSIALLAELKTNIESTLKDTTEVFDMIYMQDWEDVDPGDLQSYWSKIVCSLDEMKEKIEEYQR